jgi:hypothetical protein
VSFDAMSHHDPAGGHIGLQLHACGH